MFLFIKLLLLLLLIDTSYVDREDSEKGATQYLNSNIDTTATALDSVLLLCCSQLQM